MSKVVFSLTDRQAEALLELARGRAIPGPRDRFHTRLVSVLFDRGLVGPGLRLTPLGLAAGTLADKLANREP